MFTYQQKRKHIFLKIFFDCFTKMYYFIYSPSYLGVVVRL